MKRIFPILISGGIIASLIFGYNFIVNSAKQAKINSIKKGWYVEILNDYINIRKDPDIFSAKIGQVKKGQVFEVLEMNLENYSFYFYKTKINETKTGWIANERKNRSYLNDVNNPNDIAYPTIKYFEDIYFVEKIEDINYDHLEVTDDREGYTVTHKVYHEVVPEEDKDQYWIVYTVTDASGKSDSKTQRIIFEKIPEESKVIDFDLYER